MYSVALGISWLACAGILLSEILLILARGFRPADIIVFGIVATHFWFLRRKKNSRALNFAAVELIVILFVLNGFLYPPPGSESADLGLAPLSFKVAIWIWLASAVVLGSGAWLCNKVARDLEKSSVH